MCSDLSHHQYLSHQYSGNSAHSTGNEHENQPKRVVAPIKHARSLPQSIVLSVMTQQPSSVAAAARSDKELPQASIAAAVGCRDGLGLATSQNFPEIFHA